MNIVAGLGSYRREIHIQSYPCDPSGMDQLIKSIPSDDPIRITEQDETIKIVEQDEKIEVS